MWVGRMSEHILEQLAQRAQASTCATRSAVLGFALLVLVGSLMVATCNPSFGQGLHKHTPRDEEVHQKFYSTWERPNYPGNSCCNWRDCFPTAFKRVAGKWYALRREITKDEGGVIEYELMNPKDADSWIEIPDAIIENNQVPGKSFKSSVDGKTYVMKEPRESPDGRSHVCMLDTSSTQRLHPDPLCAVIAAEN
jgi:hypothetical protein